MAHQIRRKFSIAAILLVVLTSLWAIGRVGLGTIPGLSSASANAFGWPFNELSEYSAFSATSPLGSLIFTLLGSNDPKVFLGLHVLAVVTAITLTLWWVTLMVPRESRLLGFRLLILSPWVALLLIFLGSYDPFTVIGFALLLLAWNFNRGPMIVVAAGIIGFQHFEQGIFAASAAFLTAIALRERLPAKYIDRRKYLMTLLGLVAGKIILTLILTESSSSGAFGRGAFWTAEWFRISIVTSINFWAVLLLSLFAGSWGLIVVTALSLEKRQKSILFFAFVLCFFPSLIVLDHTRVFVMTSMMALSIITVAFVSSKEIFSKKEFYYVEALAWLIVPVSVWVGMDGTPYLNPVGSLDQLIIFYNQVLNL